MRRSARIPARNSVARRAACASVALAFVLGCRANKNDLDRWERTLNGPDKIVAVLTHDKYEKDLRVEAAWSLVEMKKRGGQAVGLTRLIEELGKLPVAERREIVAGLWQRMAPKVAQPIEPAGEGRWADPAVLFKDATFALLSDERLDLDPKLREEMTRALGEWAVGRDGEPADKRLQAFETRMDNTAQAYGVEQVLRKLGPPVAVKLPSLLTAPSAIKSDRIDTIVRVVVDSKPAGGDKAQVDAHERSRDELSANFAAILRATLGEGYVAAVKSETEDALRRAPQGKAVLDNPEAYKAYMSKVRDDRLQKLFAVAKQVGRRPVNDTLYAVANDPKAQKEHRALALAALEGNVDTSTDAQLKGFLAIAKGDAPDEVKHGALMRISAWPPDHATKALYELFDHPNWKVRYDGAMTVLGLMQKVGDKTKTTPKEFLAKLPTKDSTKMGLGEVSSYGTALSQLPKELGAKHAIDDALKGAGLGAHLTALGWYYAVGTKDDLALLAKAEGDKSSVPKCKEEDECGWDRPGCPVPKEGKADEVEYKSVSTVGEYVQYCVKPAIEARAKAPKDSK